ncbi:hypothetical protein SFHH103_03720 [Sinorhizobium fredii HH103]|uniref:Uncharacterized protein n=1 Tax=Sinorhizobium fredii (strain HH103) TaxID=1117943 RepID=G9A590_SINF1|nr:hypothetical protein SFHH103_03720 [Sinorhizobium fredii HH103]
MTLVVAVLRAPVELRGPEKNYPCAKRITRRKSG